MLIVVAIILAIIGIITGVSVAKCYSDGGDSDDCVGRLLILGFDVVAFIGIVTTMICFSASFANEHVIDQKIEMYEEQNAQIEAEIDVLVAKYMDFEADIYEKLKAESSITLVNLYPDLKSDELVKQQIELYRSNNAKIVELKKQKIDLSTKRWLVYFGR